MNHEDYKEMLALDALGALDENERRVLEEHLAGCEECRAELNGWQEIAASLAYGVAPVAPSARVRESLLANLKSQTTGLREASDTQQIGTEEGAHEDHDSTSGSNVMPLRAPTRHRPRQWFGNSPLLIGSIAASLVIAALALSLATLWNRNREMRAQLAQLTDGLHETQAQLARSREDRQLLAAPDAHIAALAGTDRAKKARARLTYDQQTGRAVLVANDLPPTPAGKAYQLWFIADGKPLPGGVFQTDASGHGELHDQVPPAGREHGVVFAITLEPQGGTSAPTGAIYLKGSAS